MSIGYSKLTLKLCTPSPTSPLYHTAPSVLKSDILLMRLSKKLAKYGVAYLVAHTFTNISYDCPKYTRNMEASGKSDFNDAICQWLLTRLPLFNRKKKTRKEVQKTDLTPWNIPQKTSHAPHTIHPLSL